MSLIVWGASASATARLRADLLRARQSLEAIPTPLPEVRNLSGQLDLATAERDALHEFVASTAGENHDWDNILGALLDHDTGRIALRTLYHNGVLLNVSGLALTREDVTAYEERLARSGAFEQVTIQAMEDISAPFPGGPAVPATAIIPPGTPLPTIQDRFEIDDFAPGAITPNEVQQHNFSPVADIDQVTFVGQAGQRYCVLALPQVAGVDPTLDVFVDGTTYSNNNCTSQTMPLVSCLCPTGSVGAPLAALVEFQITPSGSRTVQIRVRNQGSYGPDMWYLLSVSAQGQPATAVVGDIYEPDDVTPRALVLLEQQQHTFFPAGDVDWVAFGVRAGRTYDIRTFNLAPGVDTGLSVDVGGLNFANDNAAPADPSSRVTFVSPVDGQATVVITNRGQFGADKMYWITAVEVGVAPTASPVSPSPAPISCNDPYEPDDTVDRLIAPGEQQQRTFCPGGDVDRVRFLALANHRYRVQTAGLAPGVDTVLNVSMGATTLTNDDRSAGDPASLIEFTNTSGVDQAATVTISNKGAFGAERIAVIRVDDLGSESPDAYEPDIPNKRLISIGEVQRHNFYPSGDIDRLVLVTKAGRRYAVMTCGNAYDPALGGSCQPLAPGVDTVLVTTGAVANCAPAGCQNDDVSPGTSHRGSRVEFDSPSNAEVTLSIYNNGSFGPGQEYYIRADEIGVIPTTSTPTTTTAPSPLPSQTFTPLPSLTFTPIPSSTFTPPPTPSPTDTPTAPPSVTPTMTATPTATGASRMRDGPSLTRPPDVDMTERTLTQGAGVRRWGLQAPDRQGTTIVRFVLSCRIRDTAP